MGRATNESEEIVVLAEFCLKRVFWITLVCVVIFIGTYTSPNWNAGLSRNNFDNNRVFVAILVFVNGIGAFLALAMLARTLFGDKIAVYVRHNRLYSVWAFGVTEIDFNNISSLSVSKKWPATIFVHLIKRGRIYLPVLAMKTSSADLLDRLKKEIGLS